MANSILLVLVLAATTYSAVIKTEDALLKRLTRSPCSDCAPTPPVLRTQNWSGIARNSNGVPNAVFSGAAAAADEGTQTAGQAFSLASSTAGAAPTNLGGVTVGARFGGPIQASNSGSAGASSSSSASSASDSVAGYGGSDSQKASSGYGGEGHGFGENSFKESHYQHSNLHFDGQGQQGNGFAKGPQSSFSSGQTSSFGGNNGEVGGQQQQQQLNADFAASGRNERSGGHGGYHSSEGSKQGDFTSAASSAQSSAVGNGNGVGTGNYGSGFSSGQGEGSFESQKSGGHDKYGSDYSSGQGESSYEGHQSGKGQGKFGSGFASEDQQQQTSSFGDNGHGNYESGFSSGGQQYRHGHGPRGLDSGFSNGKSERQFRSQQSGFQGQQDRGFGGSEGQGKQGQASFGSSSFGNGNRQQSGSGSFGNGKIQAAGSGSGQFEQGASGSGSAAESQQAGGYYRSSANDGKAALTGALDLASQGLQTAQKSGCSTCGKNSYALSNAKSWSGSAVALSIGG